jgi:O-antigen/teichoic acid export membrane protein
MENQNNNQQSALKKQGVKAVYWTALQQILNQIIGFGISIILARLLLPEEFGLIGMIAIFIAIGNLMMQGGMTSSIIRSKTLDNNDYTTVFYFNLFVGLIMYLILYVAAPWIANFYQQDILTYIIRIYGLIFILQAFSAIQYAYLNRIMNFKKLMMISVPSLLLAGITGIVMAIKGYGVWSLVGYKLSQAFFNAVFYWFSSHWRPNGKFDKEKFKTHFNFGYKLTVSGLIDTIFRNLYSVVIGKFFPVAQVGFYQRANSLQQLPTQSISMIISKVSYPLFSKIQDDNVRLKNAYKKILKIIVFILSPVLIIMGILATPLFRFLFTEKWLPAVPYFQILLFAGILYPIHAYNLNIVKVKGRSDLFLKLEIIKKIIIVSVVIFAIRYGIYGLLYSIVFTSVTSFFINTHFSGKLINYSTWEQFKDIAPYFLISLITGLLIYFTDLFLVSINQSDFVRLLSGSIIGSIIYLSMSFILKLQALQEIIVILQQRNKNEK